MDRNQEKKPTSRRSNETGMVDMSKLSREQQAAIHMLMHHGAGAPMGMFGVIDARQQVLDNQAEVVESTEVKKIIIPHTMTKLEAAEELERQWDEEENEIDVNREFNKWNWRDFLVAVKRASEQHFGWINGKDRSTFFRRIVPTELEIVVDIVDGKKITETCFYNGFSVAAWEDAAINVSPRGMISATVKKRYAKEVKKFYDVIQEMLDTKSIYRGKSVVVTVERDPEGNENLDYDLFELKVNNKIVLNDDTEAIIKNFITDDLGEEGKRTYLLSGGYGNGKTEAAMLIGAHGRDKGMAFFYCKDATKFPELLAQAINYQPAIVFLEDVDEIASGNERDARMNNILNTVDGVQTKGSSLTVIFTTNHESKIAPALRRPGRIDLVVAFENPNKEAVALVYEKYMHELKGASKLDYAKLAEKTPDCSGAVLAEIAKRAVKLMKKRGEASNEYVTAAIESMKHHMKLMTDAVDVKPEGEVFIQLKNFAMQNGTHKLQPSN